MDNEEMLKLILDKFDGLEKDIKEIKENQNDMKEDINLISRTVNRIENNLKNHTHEMGKFKIVNE
ncbi:hypothetical protein [Orenia marismortui]|uniref:Uncharacterized protein n=1 Tax=Orenia marismortui TaxID=46469 RepID=A0A4R8GQ20_9FIRM|nr:hypothetical protein [Orenia marismortui]TDX44581.1 hypothetical protein C7959_1505 [Orenia marismortui]